MDLGWVVGYEERTTQRTKFYFQLFESPINYNLIRKLALGPNPEALRGDTVISQKFLIKYYEYSFDYLIVIMNQLWLTLYLVYSTVCSLPDTDLQNLLNS